MARRAGSISRRQRTVVVARTRVKVTLQMRLHLHFGLGHKPQTDAITRTPGQRTQGAKTVALRNPATQ